MEEKSVNFAFGVLRIPRALSLPKENLSFHSTISLLLVAQPNLAINFVVKRFGDWWSFFERVELLGIPSFDIGCSFMSFALHGKVMLRRFYERPFPWFLERTANAEKHKSFYSIRICFSPTKISMPNVLSTISSCVTGFLYQWESHRCKTWRSHWESMLNSY